MEDIIAEYVVVVQIMDFRTSLGVLSKDWLVMLSSSDSFPVDVVGVY